MFLSRRLTFVLVLIFILFTSCESLMELARAMEGDDDDYTPPKLKEKVEKPKKPAAAEKPERTTTTTTTSTATATSNTTSNKNNAAATVHENERHAADDGFFRLTLNEKTGSFTLYFLSDPVAMRYVPLFNAKDPSASYVTVFADGNVYQPGDSKQFKTRFERIKGDPAIIYESAFLTLKQIFTPIRTSSSPVANGVLITFILENIATQRSAVGIRMLLDTDLGEGKNQVPFITNTQVVSSELLLEGNSNERFWVSRGKNIALMGSIVSPVNIEEKGPDLVHMANWKRLSDTPWRLTYMEGRSFSKIPSSIRDSAVCYFFGPVMLDKGHQQTYTVYLTTEDVAWYELTAPSSSGTASFLNQGAHAKTVSTPVTPVRPAPVQTPAPVSHTQQPAPQPAPIQTPAPVSHTPQPVPQPAPVQTPAPQPEPEAVQAPAPSEYVNDNAAIVPEPVYIDTEIFNIALIEADAKAEYDFYLKAGIFDLDVNVIFLKKLQNILDQFIVGIISLNEQDLIDIEGAIERLRFRN